MDTSLPKEAAHRRVAAEYAAREVERAERQAEMADRLERLAAAKSGRLATILRSRADLHRNVERLHRVAGALHTARTGPRPSSECGERNSLIASVADVLMAQGAAVLLMRTPPDETFAAASGRTAALAQDLELTLGEGPARDAAIERTVITADASTMAARWPLYGPAIAALGVSSVTAAPLVASGRGIGALTVFDQTEQPRGGRSLVAVIEIAATIMHGVLLDVDDSTAAERRAFLRTDAHAVAHQAAGIVSVQCECDIDTAFALLRARSFSSGESLTAVATRIVRGDLRL